MSRTRLLVLFTAIAFQAALTTGGDLLTKRLEVPASCIALYPLNRHFGTKEIDGRASDGVPHGVQLAPGPDGTIDGSYEFAGNVNSYILFPNNGQLDTQHSMTMLCWVNPGGQDGPLFNYKPSSGWGVHLWVVGGQLFVRFTRRDYSFTTALGNTVLTPGHWKFVGASYDSATGDAKLWIDGTLVQTLNIGVNLHLATQDDVRMGVKADDGRYFKGRIAQMQVYNEALSQLTIQAIKDQIQIAVPDPMALYPLNSEYGTREIAGRTSDGVPHGVETATGPRGGFGGSYEFAGSANSYIEFPNNGQLDAQRSMTMLCWVNPGGQDGPLFNYKPSSAWGVHLWIVAGQLFVRFTRRNYSFTNALINTVLTPGQWKFVGASYDHVTGDAKLWIDGAIVQTLNIGANLHLATQDDVRMGVKADDGRVFKGKIARMQVYNTALTQNQIQILKEQF